MTNMSVLDSFIRRTNDGTKMRAALANTFTIIRMCQWDVWENRMDWRSMLKNAVKENHQISYLASDPALYAAHQRLLNNC